MQFVKGDVSFVSLFWLSKMVRFKTKSASSKAHKCKRVKSTYLKTSMHKP